MYYLTSGGADSRSCGRTESTACRTLSYAIRLFYDTTLHQPRAGIELRTSTALTVADTVFQVRVHSHPEKAKAEAKKSKDPRKKVKHLRLCSLSLSPWPGVIEPLRSRVTLTERKRKRQRKRQPWFLPKVILSDAR